MRELKISERMSKPALKVEPGMPVAEVLILVAVGIGNRLAAVSTAVGPVGANAGTASDETDTEF
jgi:hypothetical protein